ncbi:hypothetical protein PR048_028221 [Dryococelus australis]|uniref:Uncharacterized protein n=1 Tax=Dryococelus australis TaxID=614101 RepID=A0ABQ9GIK1_9NEOP|nr:hypothetical protein PR048_028221 [Dryococelus australis]
MLSSLEDPDMRNNPTSLSGLARTPCWVLSTKRVYCELSTVNIFWYNVLKKFSKASLRSTWPVLKYRSNWPNRKFTLVGWNPKHANQCSPVESFEMDLGLLGSRTKLAHIFRSARLRYTCRSSGRRVRKMGDPRENLLTSSIVQHDFHLQKFGANRPEIEPSSPWWEASSLTAPPL